MKKITLSLLFTLSILNAYEDLGTYGETYEIKERSFIEELNERATKVDKKKIEKTIKEAARKSLMISSSIKACTQNQIRVFEPLVTVTQDVIIPYTDNLIQKKGTQYNILEQNRIQMPYHMMFIDGNDEVQIELAKIYKSQLKHQLRILLVRGDFLKLAHEPLFKDMKVARDKHESAAFKLQCVPSIYTQKNYVFEVTEYSPEELKKKKEDTNE